MIKLRDSCITDSLPTILSKQPWVQALGWALCEAFRTMLDYADRARTYSLVDALDHPVLDALAVDLYVRQYDRAFDLATKRRLIKYALQYWSTAGSVAATEDVARIIFGEADVHEWFEYGGHPGCFKVSISDTLLTDADVLRFVEAAQQNKRLSAWLDTVWLEMASKNFEKYVGIISADGEIDTHAQQRDPDRFFAFFSQDTQSELFEMEENQS